MGVTRVATISIWNRDDYRDFFGCGFASTFAKALTGFFAVLTMSCPVGQSSRSGQVLQAGRVSVHVFPAKLLSNSVNSMPFAFGT